MSARRPRRLRFGGYEVDLSQRELRRSGVRVKLQDQPFRVLAALLERPGEIVARETLRHKLWAADEFVEFDRSLTTAIQKIRQALQDSAASPRFIETVPRLGYRFIAPVEVVADSRSGSKARVRGIVAAIALGAVAALLAIGFRSGSASDTEVLNGRFRAQPLTYEAGIEEDPSFSPDGARIAYGADGGRPGAGDIYIRLTEPGAGAPVRVTRAPERDIEPDWSADGRRLVFARILTEGGMHQGVTFKLMLAPPLADAPVHELDARTFHARNPGGIEPTWSADGRHVVFACKLDPEAAQVQICLYSLEQRDVWALTTTSGSGVGDYFPSISPDGRMLAFQASSRPDEVGVHLLQLDDRMRPAGEPSMLSGADGVHQSFWSSDGDTLYLMGCSVAGECGLRIADLSAGSAARLAWPLVETRGGTADVFENPAGEIRAAYTARVEDAELVRIDLADRPPESARVLAPSNFIDYHPQFSADGSQIAFMSSRSGMFGVWLCDRDGANVRSLTDVGRYAYFSIPMWSPRGDKIAIDGFLGARNAHVVDIATKQVGPALTTREGRMPAWSADARGLWCYSHQDSEPALWRIDLNSGTPKKIRDAPGIIDIAEAPDGKSLYFTQDFDLMRASLRDGEITAEPEVVASDVAAFALTDGAFYVRERSGAIHRTDTATGERTFVLQTDGMQSVPNLGFTVSRDERWLVYTRWLRLEKDIRLLTTAAH